MISTINWLYSVNEYRNPFTPDLDNVSNNVLTWLPLDVVINDATIASEVDPTTYIRWKFFEQDLTQVGTTAELTSSDTEDRDTVNGTLTAATAVDLTEAHLASTTYGTALSGKHATVATSYECGTTPEVDLHVAGARTSSYSPTTSNKFVGFGHGASTTDQTVADVLWPTSGTFKYVAVEFVAYASDLPHNIIFGLLINGAESDISFTEASTADTSRQFTLDTSTTAAIAAGQKVCWFFRRSHGTGTATFAAIFTVGFIAD